jgi:hypothetical protein
MAEWKWYLCIVFLAQRLARPTLNGDPTRTFRRHSNAAGNTTARNKFLTHILVQRI